MNQIYFEFEDNLEDFERDFLIYRMGFISYFNVMNFLDGKKVYFDILILDFYWMIWDEYIFVNVIGYENLKIFGINLIKDDILCNFIMLVYNYDFFRLIKGSILYFDLNVYLFFFF